MPGGKTIRVRFPTTAAAIVALFLGGQSASAYSATYTTLYGGPFTRDFGTDVLFHGDFRTSGAMLGLAIDHTLLDLGSGFALLGEFQTTRYLVARPVTEFSAGLGVGYRMNAPGNLPVTIEFYMGPSYALDPFTALSGAVPSRHKWLNYFSNAITFGIPHAPGWSLALRTFHRSGMYGVYARNLDEGSTVGAGIRYRF